MSVKRHELGPRNCYSCRCAFHSVLSRPPRLAGGLECARLDKTLDITSPPPPPPRRWPGRAGEPWRWLFEWWNWPEAGGQDPPALIAVVSRVCVCVCVCVCEARVCVG